MTFRWSWIVVAAAAIVCGGQRDSRIEFEPVPPARAAAIEASVRAFAQDVADEVSRDGPAAWRTHFADDSAFFIAADGQLVIPNTDAATPAIEALARTTKQIVLRWGEPMRIDPVATGLALLAAPYSETRVDVDGRRVYETGYFTGLAEYRNDRWRFRNAHWSAAVAPQATP